MSEQSKKITRDEFYEEVWRTPMNQLAATSGACRLRVDTHIDIPLMGPEDQLVISATLVVYDGVPSLNSDVAKTIALGRLESWARSIEAMKRQCDLRAARRDRTLSRLHFEGPYSSRAIRLLPNGFWMSGKTSDHSGRARPRNGGSNRVDGNQNLLRLPGIGDFQAEVFVESDDELKCIHRIQAQTAGAEKGLVVLDIVGRDLKHQVLDHQLLELLAQGACVVHQKIPPSILSAEPVM